MRLKVLVIGKLKDKHFQSRVEEYSKWLTQNNKIEILELPDSTKEKENELLLKHIEKENHAYIVALSEDGKELTSRELASKLGAIQQKIVFIIGGPYGLTNEVKEKAEAEAKEKAEREKAEREKAEREKAEKKKRRKNRNCPQWIKSEKTDSFIIFRAVLLCRSSPFDSVA